MHGVQVVNKDLLKILACPVCKGSVEEKNDKITCLKCGRKYPVRDSIPVMLVDAAEERESGR